MSEGFTKLTEEYWRAKLEGAPREPLFRKGGSAQGGISVSLQISDRVRKTFDRVARESNRSRLVLGLAALHVVLVKYGVPGIVIAAPPIGRYGDAKRCVFFRPNSSNTVGGLVTNITQELAEVELRQDFDTSRFVEKYGALGWGDPEALFQVGFRMGDICLAPLDSVALSFDLTPRDGALMLTVSSHSVLLERMLPTALADAFERALKGVLIGPDHRIAKIEILAESEIRRLTVMPLISRPPASPHPETLDRLLSLPAAADPCRDALVFAGCRLDRGTVDRRANTIAHLLRQQGIERGQVVALMMERSVEAVTTILAVWKAGGAVLPIDPTLPAARARFMIENSGARLAVSNVTDGAWRPEGVSLLDSWYEASECAEPPPALHSPDDLAAVFYTSGSTGHPKGVAVTHRALAHKAVGTCDLVGFDQDLRLPMVASYSFDAALHQILVAVHSGGTLIVPSLDEQSDPLRFWPLMIRERANGLNCVPAFLSSMLDAPPPKEAMHLRWLILGGDRLTAGLANRARKDLSFDKLVNLYGPTEITIECTTWISSAQHFEEPIPIGAPSIGYRIYVLDRFGGLAPMGASGEIVVAGQGLSEGYLHRNDLTAERFLPDPFVPGERMYKTGDLGRWRSDGQIEMLGRADTQIKLRGNRIEPGEIEAYLLRCLGIADARVIARHDGLESALSAYYVGQCSLNAEEIKSHLRQYLPEVMIPAHIVRLEHWPLTPSGKIDERAFPAPQKPQTKGLRPRNDIERRIESIWCELLNVRSIGIERSFFDVGGHSLKAIRMIQRLRAELDVEIGLREVFEYPTIIALAERIVARRPRAEPPIQRVAERSRYPLSHAQQRVWLQSEIEPRAALAYNMCEVFRVRGPLQPAALRRALAALSQRHESLRTTFTSENGVPFQIVHEIMQAKVEIANSNGCGQAREEAMDRLFVEEAERPFDLVRGPLFRVRLLRFGSDDHALGLTIHHIISDGWSMAVICRELVQLYQAALSKTANPLPPLSLHYRDYAAWQEEYLTGERAALDRMFWVKRLTPPMAPLMLNADRARPERRSFRAGTHAVYIDGEVLDRLRAMAKNHGGTTFITALALISALLARHTARNEIVVGSPVACRGRPELDSQIGLFVNTIISRTEVDLSESFSTLFARIQRATLEAYQHQDYPFDCLVNDLGVERSLGRNPLCDVLVEMVTENPLNTWQSCGSTMRMEPHTPRLGSRGFDLFDLTVSVHDRCDRMDIRLGFSLDLFRPSTIALLGEHLVTLAADAARNPSKPVGNLEMISDEERQKLLVEFNVDSDPQAPNSTLHQLVATTARTQTDATAVFFKDVALSYGELEGRANTLARLIRAAVPIKPDDAIGICMHRSEWLVVALLGALKSGGAYLPIDPSSPSDRIRRWLGQGVRCVLADRVSAVLVRALNLCPVIVVDEVMQSATTADPSELPPSAGPKNLAYVMPTSGSSGQSKGVMVEHWTVQKTVSWRAQYYRFSNQDRILQVPPVFFDSSVNDFFSTLIGGAALVMIDEERRLDVDYLAGLIARHSVTHIMMVPSLYQLLLNDHHGALGGLAHVALAGERLPLGLSNRHFRLLPHVPLFNEYGPAEASVGTTVFQVVDPEEEVPIGEPIWGHIVDVLGPDQALTPIGIIGELCISGNCLARGYWNDLALTREKFVTNPYRPGHRMYRSGDLARWRPDGNLEFMGRIDDQLKIEGSRVEPGEIEACLLEHPSVLQCAVVPRASASNEVSLVAYVVSLEPPDIPGLREHVATRLPRYMVPSVILPIAALPRTASGKIDRRGLPAISCYSALSPPTSQPSDMERRVKTLWEEVLEEPITGVNLGFFELGGTSLRATRLAAAVRRELGISMSVRDVFLHQTIRSMASWIDSMGTDPRLPIEPAPSAGRYPLSYAQRRLYVATMASQSGAAFVMYDAFDLADPPDPESLQRALDEMVARHEVLRTRFSVHSGQPIQIILGTGQVSVSIVDLSDDAMLDAEIMRAVPAAFLVHQWPLFSVTLIRRRAGFAVLVVAAHHLIADATSMELFTREWLLRARAIKEGHCFFAPPLRIQSKDFAVAEAQWLDSGPADRIRHYWSGVLAGSVPPIDLPTDFPRQATRGGRGALAEFEIGASAARALTALGRENNSTPFITLYAAIVALFHKITGQRDFIFGFPISGRTRPELDVQLGCFTNAVPLRIEVEPETTFLQLLRNVRCRCLEAYDNQEYPFDRIVESISPKRYPGRSLLFDVGFTWEAQYDLAGTGAVARETPPRSVHVANDLWFYGRERAGRFEIELAYDAELFVPESAQAIGRYLALLVDQICAEPSGTLSGLSLEQIPGLTNPRRATQYSL